MGATFVLVGLFTSMIFPVLIEKFHWFRRSLRIIATGACAATILALICIPTGSFVASIISIGSMGAFLIPTLCVCYSFCTELTYPVSVALFGCLLQAGASIYGTLMTYLCTYIINSYGSLYVIILYIIFFATCSLLSICIGEDLRRINLSKKRRNDRSFKNKHI